MALIETGIQLYLEYQAEIHRVDDQIVQIKTSYLKSITKSTWNLEADEVSLQLEGALQLKDIRYLEVKTETGDTLAFAGNQPLEKVISRNLVLKYSNHGKVNVIGNLQIIATIEGVRQRIAKKAILMVISRIIVALIISGIFLIIFQRLVSRHLSKMAHYTQHLDLNNLGSPLRLSRFETSSHEKDELSKVVHAINGMQSRIQEDITEIKHTKAILEESEKKYRKLFESSMDAIILLDLKKGYLDCNQAALKLFGIKSKEKLSSLTPSALSPEYQPDGTLSSDKAEKMIEKALDSGSNFFEWTHKRLDGKIFIANVLATRTEIEGRVVLQGSIRDISEYKKTQELMVQSEKMMSIGGLAAGMAHEINNPLAGMVQSANLLSNRLLDTKLPANRLVAQKLGINVKDITAYMDERGIPKFISAINDTGQRMSAIVKNMLNFARKTDMQVSSHHLSGIIDKTLDLAGTDFDLKKSFDFKMIDIKKVYDKTMPLILCDSGKIQQVILNVIRNGAQAMQEDETLNPQFVIQTSVDEAIQMGCIEIEDNGPGMNNTTLKRIFEPFFTTKPVGVGTGLGLSVSYFIITENHKGQMSAESNLGQGTKFIIRLPIQEPSNPV